MLQDGRVVEEGPFAELIANPRHPYTRSLVEAVRGRPADVLRDAPRAADALTVSA